MNGLPNIEEEKGVCEACLAGKRHQFKFDNRKTRATQVLELVQSDVCVPMRIQSLGGAKYFLTFIK